MPAVERLLAPVPAATCAQAGISGNQRWVAQFNVACWLRCRAQGDTLVRLLLRWRDAGGQSREVEVDRAVLARESTLLLSALCEVAAQGRIEEMSAWLACEPGGDIAVDELYVQRAGSQAGARPLIAGR